MARRRMGDLHVGDVVIKNGRHWKVESVDTVDDPFPSVHAGLVDLLDGSYDYLARDPAEWVPIDAEMSTPYRRVSYEATLRDAAHELGHFLVARALGLPVVEVCYDRSTGEGRTCVRINELTDTDPDHRMAWLTCCVAGHEAEVLWGERHGVGATSGDVPCSFFLNFRSVRRYEDLSDPQTRKQARRTARKLLRRRWDNAEHAVSVLASQGRLFPNTLSQLGMS